MAFQVTGAVDIPSEEFWMWVAEQTGESDNIYQSDIRWDGECLILKPVESDNEVVIDGVDFWSFVLLYTPDISGSEYQFSLPQFSACDVSINFIATTSKIDQEIKSKHSDIFDSWIDAENKQLFM